MLPSHPSLCLRLLPPRVPLDPTPAASRRPPAGGTRVASDRRSRPSPRPGERKRGRKPGCGRVAIGSGPGSVSRSRPGRCGSCRAGSAGVSRTRARAARCLDTEPTRRTRPGPRPARSRIGRTCRNGKVPSPRSSAVWPRGGIRGRGCMLASRPACPLRPGAALPDAPSRWALPRSADAGARACGCRVRGMEAHTR